MNSDSNPFISGKVVLQDGSPLTESVAIQSVCNGRKHVEAYTDSSGSFLFQFAAATTGMLSSGLGEGDNSMRSTDTLDGRIRNFRNCDLRAVLQGFTSDSVNLS
ncbi:MAG: hypothetical protein H0X25_05610 [Acidobacteriales bacterium]|nr:hypothetical protein [Terriglobales bacterium]